MNNTVPKFEWRKEGGTAAALSRQWRWRRDRLSWSIVRWHPAAKEGPQKSIGLGEKKQANTFSVSSRVSGIQTNLLIGKYCMIPYKNSYIRKMTSFCECTNRLAHSCILRYIRRLIFADINLRISQRPTFLFSDLYENVVMRLHTSGYVWEQ